MADRAYQRTLDQGSGPTGLCRLKLDPEDEWLRLKLRLHPSGYAYLRSQQVHRVVLDAPKGTVVDHINGDKLDNRKDNLRLATHIENGRNSDARWGSSAYRGVTWYAPTSRWMASIRHNKRLIFLGYFRDPEEANKVRLLKERELWGVQPRRLTAFLEAGIEVTSLP